MVEVINQVVWGVLTLFALAFWWRLRSRPSAWLAATFSAIGFILFQGLVVPAVDPADQPLPQFSTMELYTDLIVIVLLALPYLLHRFARSLVPGHLRGSRLADMVMAAMAAITLVAPGFPAPDAEPPSWFSTYLVAFLAAFTIPLIHVTWVLWRLGIGQPGVVRSRMRLMAIAASLLAASFVGTTVVGGGDEPALLPQALGWGSAVAFLLAFNPPGTLRRFWRAKDEAALRTAEHGLLSAQSAEAAARAVAPIAPALVGGVAATISNADGELLASHGSVELLDEDGAEQLELRIDGQTVSLRVLASPTTPVFGRGEEELLGQLAGHLDLAMQRLSALEVSQASLAAAQRANEELQQLVYGVSHDMRNPLVTILGFLGVFDDDGHESLTDRQKLARERIGVSAQYMESLVEDLLQLSRIGRMDVDTSEIDLRALIEDISADILATEDEMTVTVVGDATVQMSPVRARQLFTNLTVNAARHGGVRPLEVTVSLQPAGDDVTVRFSDNGVGIPLEDHEKVFRIFQRLARFDANAKGSGIGLTMCQRIVEEAGGTIVIDGTSSGTTFVLTLPTPSARLSHLGTSAVKEPA